MENFNVNVNVSFLTHSGFSKASFLFRGMWICLSWHFQDFQTIFLAFKVWSMLIVINTYSTFVTAFRGKTWMWMCLSWNFQDFQSIYSNSNVINDMVHVYVTFNANIKQWLMYIICVHHHNSTFYVVFVFSKVTL